MMFGHLSYASWRVIGRDPGGKEHFLRAPAILTKTGHGVVIQMPGWLDVIRSDVRLSFFRFQKALFLHFGRTVPGELPAELSDAQRTPHAG
jgi:hypothetical protein